MKRIFKLFGMLLFMSFCFGLLSLNSSCVTVGNGEIGVKFDPIGGGVKDSTYGEGLHVNAMWVNVIKFSTKTQAFTMAGSSESATDQTHAPSVQTTTKEGLYVTLDLTVQYRFDETKIIEIYKSIGNEQVVRDVIILPQIRSTIRDVVSQYTAAEVYGEGKAKIEADIYNDLVKKLGVNHVICESVLLRNVGLPDNLTKAIEAKQTAEQQVLQMQFTLDQSALEAQRKAVEAGGIASANKIISGSLTDAYLQWYWIQTMSDNPKVIYIPVGDNGLPIFKDVG